MLRSVLPFDDTAFTELAKEPNIKYSPAADFFYHFAFGSVVPPSLRQSSFSLKERKDEPLLLGGDKAEAYIVEAGVGRVVAAVRTPAVLRTEVPTAAAHHAVRA